MQTIDAILIPPRRREAKSQPLLALAVVFATLLGVGCAPAQPQALHPASSEALAADASLAQERQKFLPVTRGHYASLEVSAWKHGQESNLDTFGLGIDLHTHLFQRLVERR